MIKTPSIRIRYLFWKSCRRCTASAGRTPGTAGPWASNAFRNWITSTTKVFNCLSSSCSNEVRRSLTRVCPNSSAIITRSAQFFRKLSTCACESNHVIKRMFTVCNCFRHFYIIISRQRIYSACMCSAATASGKRRLPQRLKQGFSLNPELQRSATELFKSQNFETGTVSIFSPAWVRLLQDGGRTTAICRTCFQ